MAEDSKLRPIEIGLIVAGELDQVDTQAVQRVKESLLAEWESSFPRFAWTIELIWRRELVGGNRVEPMILIDMAREERDGRDWDFVFVITSAELITHYKPFAYAVISRSVDTAVISTVRIDPRMEKPLADSDSRIRSVSQRLVTLIRQAFGAINGLEHESELANVMTPIENLTDLDDLENADWLEEQEVYLNRQLELIADLRLEEAEPPPLQGTFRFYLKSAWINRHEIRDAILRARPWEFPVRLNRMTTATCSTAVILLCTAELWELAINQSLTTLIVFALMAICVTTAYITKRQQLLVRRESRISEQSVITNVSAVGVVLAGMLVTFVSAIGLIILAALGLFQSQVIHHWADLEPGELSGFHYVYLAVFAASLAIIIGALGASFEEQQYFRHITFVDEEI